MNSIEIKSNENVVCPFCNQITVDVNAEESIINLCQHLVYAATDASLDYRSDIINDLFDIKPEEENFDLTLNDITDHPKFDQIFNEGKLKDLIQYESYEPAPSFFGAYFGFIQNQ